MLMTKEQKIDAYIMRLNGASLQTVADKYGVTREYIRQITCLEGPRKNKNYIYPNIADWLFDQGIYAKEFAVMIDASNVSLTNWMLGRTQPTMYHIKKILEVTGMTFEYAFALKGESHDTH